MNSKIFVTIILREQKMKYNCIYLIILILFLFGYVTSASAQIESSMRAQGYIDVHDVDSTIYVSLMYSRPNNFTGKVLYQDLHHAFLHPDAALALKKAQSYLKTLHPELSLIIFDAARPMSVQQKMWNIVKGTRLNIYVSNPANGGGLHNYGFAVDVSICDAKGDTIPMGTKIDYMGRAAHPEYESEMLRRKIITQEAVSNRILLRNVLAVGGFKVLKTEWWHFNFKTRTQIKAEGRVPIK